MKIIQKIYNNSGIRYIFFGGCTTLVNLVSFYLLRRAGIELNISNIISIILAVLFAYFVNAKFVFEGKLCFSSFCKFIGARATTMIIEVGGVWLLVSIMNFPDMIGKFLTQIIVLILNYIFSKFFVFKKK